MSKPILDEAERHIFLRSSFRVARRALLAGKFDTVAHLMRGSADFISSQKDESKCVKGDRDLVRLAWLTAVSTFGEHTRNSFVQQAMDCPVLRKSAERMKPRKHKLKDKHIARLATRLNVRAEMHAMSQLIPG